jgi:hypothetical protein
MGIFEDVQEEGQVMLKVGVILLVIMLAYAGVYSLMNIFAPKVMLGSTLEATAGRTLANAESDGYLKALNAGQRNEGLYALTTTIAGFFVLFAGFRKAQKWAWWAFLVVGGIAWLWGVITAIGVGAAANFILMLIGAVIFLVGLLLPVRVFFAKEAEAVQEEPKEAEEAQETQQEA